MSYPQVNRTPSLRLSTDEFGLSTVEYVIILVLIAAAAVGAWQMLGATLLSKLTAADTVITQMHGMPDADVANDGNASVPSPGNRGQLPVSKQH